jgi:hypothetical protein
MPTQSYQSPYFAQQWAWLGRTGLVVNIAAPFFVSLGVFLDSVRLALSGRSAPSIFSVRRDHTR